MENFINTLVALGIEYESDRIDEKNLNVFVKDDSGCKIAEFVFEDTDNANFVKVRSVA